MGFERRTRGKLSSPGPYLAEIVNHLDPTYMGGLEVAMIQGMPNTPSLKGETFVVQYLSPFYGVTSKRFEGTNSGDFNDVQKSYGMWMVPPDVGTTVMCIFIDGDPNQGYWMGCVQDPFQNHMVPGIAASKQTLLTPEQKQRYGTDYLPVGEFLKGTQKLNDPNIGRIGKPVHPFADRLLSQGLLLDTVRGVTSSSARREVPSHIFGISTPGPVDTSDGAKRGKIGYEGDRQIPVSRLGGSQFVMDDGDINGQNELVRLRTRTGHQILMHNSQDLIYIGNSKGTSWIELTSDGKIDIYAEDSVSIHTKADFNFFADRDINMEAGRNIRMKATGDMDTNVTGHYYLTVDDNAKIAIKNDKDETIGQSSRISVGIDQHMSVSKNLFVTAGGDLHLGAVGNMIQGSSKNFSVGAGGTYVETAARIDMNGPAATSPTMADPAVLPSLLPAYHLPNRSGDAEWGSGNFYKSNSITSIMQRVPTHEPYDQHENINPSQFSSSATDSTVPSSTPANQTAVIPGTCSPQYAAMINNSASTAGIDAIKSACKTFGITDPNAVATVLGIVGGESKWKPQTESFNYTTAARLLQIFPSVFNGNTALAEKYVGNPNNSLPEFVYGYQTAKGKELGNVLPGDGAKFIGRGYIQLTGRANYTKYSQLLFAKGVIDSATALVDEPNFLLDPKISAAATAAYFVDRVKTVQSDPAYFDAACHAVGNNTTDIYVTKQGLYQCFLGQLSGTTVQSGTGTIVTDSQGNPIKTGVQ
jgi:predicted chitinase